MTLVYGVRSIVICSLGMELLPSQNSYGGISTGYVRSKTILCRAAVVLCFLWEKISFDLLCSIPPPIVVKVLYTEIKTKF